MTRRLVLSYLALTVLILVVLELPLAVLAQRFERDLATTQIAREVSGLTVVVGDDLDDRRSSDLQTVVAGYESRTGGEVTVLSPSLATLVRSSPDFDSDATGDWMSLTRRALAGATASEFATDEGLPVAVVAAPVTNDGHEIAVVVLSTPADYTEDRIHEIWLALLAFAAAALMLASGAGWFLARSLGRPVAQLQSIVHRFGGGDLTSRIAGGGGPPVIRALAEDFNDMADRITDLLAAQDRFVADASHQLRSPLTALRLRIENLQADGHGPGSAALSAVASEVLRLSRIVDGLLALGRADHADAMRSGVDVAQVASERGEAWYALAAERGVRLSILGADTAWTAELVPGDLDQILDNLLANALEATPAGGRIDVQLQVGSKRDLALHVRDDGPGLNASERERAFDRFWQGPGAGGRGSGLGLSIVRQLARRNAIRVELREHPPHGLDAVVELRAVEVKKRQNLVR